MTREVFVGKVLLVPALISLVACQTTLSHSGGDPEKALLLVAQAQMALAEGKVEKALDLFARAVNLDPQSADLREEYGLMLASLGISEKALAELRAANKRSPEGEAVLGLLSAQVAATPAELEEAVAHLEKGEEATLYQERVQQTLIEAYLRLGKANKAWELIQLLLGAHPDNPWLHLEAGRSLRLLRRLPEAEEHLRQASATKELANQAVGELAEVLVAENKFKEAAAVLEKAVKEGSSPTLAGLVRWAALLLQAKEEERAIEILDEALKRDPKFIEALILRANAAILQGKADEGEHFYRQALAVNQDDVDVLLGLGRLLMELRRLDEARQLLMRAQEIITRTPGSGAAQARNVVTEEQAALELLGRAYERALPFLRELNKKPLTRRGLALWAEYFRGQKRFSEGLEFFNRLKLEESQEAAQLGRALKAEFLLATGGKEEGLAELRAMAQGAVGEVHLALATAGRVKLYQEVVAWAQAALERFSGDEEILFHLATAYERTGNFTAAEKAFRQLLAANPENASVLNYLGYTFADRGENLEEAKALIEKAVTLDPFSGAYLDSLGWVWFRLGDLDRAEKYLTQAATLEPFDPTVYEHLGDLFKSRGNITKARDAYLKALSLSPEEEGQEERIRAKLSELAVAATP